jgi:Phospholipase_D-nuclease N-terminal
VFAILALATTVFWVWTLVDCLTNESSKGNGKLVWLLVIVLLHALGALLYMLARRQQRKRDLGRRERGTNFPERPIG